MLFKFIVTFIITLLNIFLGVFIFYKNKKSKINRYYSLLCLSTALWAFFCSFLYLTTNVQFIQIYILPAIYFFGALPPLFYLMFAYHFPYIKSRYSPVVLGLSWLITSLIAILSLLGIMKMEEATLVNGQIVENVIFYNYLIFSVYFYLYIIWGFILLWQKYQVVSGINKLQLNYILLGTAITFLIISVFAIVLPLINYFGLVNLSPLFTLINFFVIAYLIFIKNR